ncbi:MAG: HAD-IIB family hydrolase [Polyangiaceae bacterium]|nr:HAD-IIB family hydrolase [Polyangiaceae bacterium]
MARRGNALDYRLLITDLDGTLIGGGGALNECDLRAITELRRRGIVVSIATGRMYSGTREIARRIGVEGPVACIDGSHIVDVGTDSDLVCHTLGTEALLMVAETLREAGAASVVFSRDVIWFDRRSEQYLPFLTVWSDRTEEIPNTLADGRWNDHDAVTALVAIAPATRLTVARDRILAEIGADVQNVLFMIDRDGNAGMILRSAGVSKGTALEWIARHHGIDASAVVAVGDWLNDIPMLETAGRAFCMAQSPPEVVATAELLEADGWNGGGIAEAAARSGLL